MNRRSFLCTTGFAASFAAVSPLRSQTLEDCPGGPHSPVPRTQDHLYRPKPQFWGFDNQDLILQAGPYFVSFQIFTLGADENSYGLAKDQVRISGEGGEVRIAASSFASAGQQTLFPGEFEARFMPGEAGTRVSLRASCQEKIRAVKMRLHRLADATIFQTGWDVDPNGLPVVENGINFSYPEYQGGMPAWQLAFGQSSLGIVSADVQPRPKRLTAYRTGRHCVIELTHEEDARRFDTSLEAPVWELLPNATLPQVIARRTGILEQQAGLRRWDARPDLPEWARSIRLVVTLHGMHWSGFVFNDYARMLAIVNWVNQRIPGRDVVFFLAAWEGRYYRKYGDSEADRRMGGEAGLRKLVEGIHARGAHVMPMFSGNYPQPGTPGYDEYAPLSHFTDASSGFRWDPMRGYVVDWGQLRGTGMAGGGPSLNLGAPAWRNFLTRQVAALNQKYGFDGSYFDTQPPAENDARYSPLEGFRHMVADLRAQKKDLLIASESWFDLSLPFVPWSQTPGGPNNWTHPYQRRFAHLSMGEPSRGSTGVHELGHIPYNRRELDEMFDIPTVAFVDGTLEHAAPELEAVIRRARAGKGPSV